MGEAHKIVPLFEVKELCCSKCKITKSSSEFQIDRQKKTGYSSSCKECRNVSGKTSYKNNKHKRIFNADAALYLEERGSYGS